MNWKYHSCRLPTLDDNHDLFGQWRIEVTPPTPDTENIFLHLIQVGETSSGSMVDSAPMKSNNMAGVHFVYENKEYKVLSDTVNEAGGKITISQEGGEILAEDFYNHDEIESAINEKRLGCLLTIHSWFSLNNYSGIETIRSSGDNRLDGKRYEWAKETLETFVEDLPRSRWAFPEKIWHKGLARDYLLDRHNAVTFRIEITTHNIDYDFLEETGRQLLKNLSKIEDWSFVLN